MRLVLAIVLAVAAAAPAVGATPAPDEGARTVDLSGVNGHVFHVKCENGRDILHCLSPTVWEETNGIPGLQTGPSGYEDLVLLG